MIWYDDPKLNTNEESEEYDVISNPIYIQKIQKDEGMWVDKIKLSKDTKGNL